MNSSLSKPLLLMALALALAVPMASAQSIDGETVFFDDFEDSDSADNWNYDESTEPSYNIPDGEDSWSGDYSASIRSGSGESGQFWSSVSAIEGVKPSEVEFKTSTKHDGRSNMKIHTPNGEIPVMVMAYSSSGNEEARLQNSSLFDTGTYEEVTTGINKDQWYNHTVDFEYFSESKVRVTHFVDGQELGSANISGFEGINNLTYHAGGGYLTEMAVDDVEVVEANVVDSDTTSDVENLSESAGLYGTVEYYAEEAQDFYNEVDNSIGCASPLVGLMGCLGDWLSFSEDDGSEDVFKDDVRANAIQIEDQREQITSEIELQMEQSFGMAQAEAKITAVELMNNGTAEAQALSEVRDSVDDFYSDQMRRAIAQWNREVLKLEQTENTLESLNMNASSIYQVDTASFQYYEQEYELPNGNTTVIYGVKDASDTKMAFMNDGALPPIETIPETNDNGDVVISSAKMVDSSAYAEILPEMESRHNTALTNVEEITSGIYTNYSDSNITAPEVMGPLEALKNSAINYNETGAYSYSTLSLEQAGLASDFNQSFTIEYQNSDMDSSEELTGQLFVDRNEFDSLETNTTYDVSSKTAYMVAQVEEDGETKAERINLDGTFSIKEMVNAKTGETVENTTVEQRTTYTPQIEELEQQLNELQEIQSELESGSGGGWFDIGTSETIIVGLVLVIAGAFLA